jgi:hypothetical protein
VTPVVPARTGAPAPDTSRRTSAPERTGPARRRKLPGSPRGPVPRRVSGPVAAPPSRPRPAPAERPVPRPRPARRERPASVPRRARKQALVGRLAVFLRSLPDHPLLDRVVRGRAWIPLLGVMLVGIVAMQVELLKLNASTGRSIELISSLQSRNDILRAQVASASDPNRIEGLAGHMGMVMPGPGSITFVRAGSTSMRRALARIQVPNLAAFEAALRVSNAAAALPGSTSAPAPSSAAPATTTTPAATAPTTTTTPETAPGTNSSNGAQAGTPSGPPATVP